VGGAERRPDAWRRQVTGLERAGGAGETAPPKVRAGVGSEDGSDWSRRRPAHTTRLPSVGMALVDGLVSTPPDVSQIARHVLLVLAVRANGDGRCYLKVATIADTCRLSERSVQNALRDLESAGLVRRVKFMRARAGGQGANTFELLPAAMERGAPSAGGGVHSVRGDKGRTSCTPEQNVEQDVLLLDGEVRGAAGATPHADKLWDALVEAVGTPAPITRSARRGWSVVHRELRSAGVTPDLLLAAAKAYRKEWPGIAVTPYALSKHLQRFMPDRVKPTGVDTAARSWFTNLAQHLTPDVFRDELDAWRERGASAELIAELGAAYETLGHAA
jgi:hypothetical protein